MGELRGQRERTGAAPAAGPAVDFALAIVYCCAHLVFFSTLARAIAPELDRIALAVIAASVAIALARVAWRGEYRAALVTSGFLVLLTMQVLVFCWHAETAPNW